MASRSAKHNKAVELIEILPMCFNLSQLKAGKFWKNIVPTVINSCEWATMQWGEERFHVLAQA